MIELTINDWEDFKTEFAGETIKMKLKPLDRAGMLKMVSVFEGAKSSKPDPADAQEGVVFLESSYKLQDLAADVIPGYVEGLEGIMINGKPATIEDVCNVPALSALALRICTGLLTISQLGIEDSKNSEGLSDSGESEDQPTTQSEGSPEVTG